MGHGWRCEILGLENSRRYAIEDDHVCDRWEKGRQMKERPIIFSGEMVRAILEGHKTMTRRVIKIHNTIHSEDRTTNYNNEITEVFHPDPNNDLWSFGLTWKVVGIRRHDVTHLRCPYGIPGDCLWVRETWCNINKPGIEPEIYYKADTKYTEDYNSSEWKWKPSIFMPRWASRITLEITNIRVERLQEITEEDALKEGVRDGFKDNIFYKTLWNSINGKKYPWESNPWVWVIGFKERGR